MAKNLNEKAVELFNKEIDIDEQLKAFYDIKELMTKILTAHQKSLEEKANETQNIIDRINP